MPAIHARLLLCLALVLPLAGHADDWLDTPLPYDTSIEYRTLLNGMRYWIRPDARPAGKVSLWLRIGSGSLDEDDDQRGLAHLLEHLAFNGSANFPAGTLIKRFQAAGLTFGAHQNATTSYTGTTYKLTIPNDPAVLELSLLYFADVAHRLTLDADEVVRERAVVQAERRARDNAATRAFRRRLAALAPGSRMIERLPIGDTAVVGGATAEQLRAYYRKWYRPDNAVLLVAGDVDAKALDALVRKHFGDWAAEGGPSPHRSPGIRFYERDRAEIIGEVGLTSADINVAYLESPSDFASVRGFRAWLVHQLGKQVINARLGEMVLEGGAPFGSASVAADTAFGKNLVEARATGTPGQWDEALKGLLVELRRAREHGVGDAELRHAKEAVLARFERAALSEADASAAQWLRAMSGVLDEDRRPLGAKQAHELSRRLLPTLTRADVENAIRARYAPARRTITLTLPPAEGSTPTAQRVLEVAQAVEAGEVAEPMAREWPAQLLARDPEPGRTVGHTLNGELNVLSATLENGVRLHIRPMDHQQDQVHVRVTLAGGRVNETPLNLGITEAAALPFKTPATDALSSTAIHHIMRTKQVTVSGRDTAGALELDITGHRRDLAEGMRLAHLLLTRARIEPAAFERWRRRAAERELNLEGSVTAQLNGRVNALLTNNDPRFRILSPEDVQRLTLADAQEWLDDILASAPIEVGIVGDISHEQALALAARYIGSLPKRAPVAEAHLAVRRLRVAPGPYADVVQVDTATPKAMVYLGWRGPDWRDVRDWQALDLAGRILTSRLLEEVRERRGLVYSIRAHSFANTLYRGNGRFRVSFVVDPLKAEEAADVAQRVVEEFMRDGPLPEELDTARRQAALSFRGGSDSPAFWLDVLADLDYMGGDLWWLADYVDKVEGYTRDDVINVAKKYLRDDRFVRVIGVPVSFLGKQDEAAPRPAVAATIE